MLIIAPSDGAAASNECANWVAKIVSTEGAVEARAHMEAAWQPVKPNQVFCPGNMLRTQAHSRAALLLNNQTVLRLSQKSTLTFPAPQADKPFWLELLNGAVNVITRTPKKFQIDTPFVNAVVDGTEFLVTTAENEATVSVFEGHVSATNPQGQLVLKSGESASASPGQPPASRILVHPRDAVQWALYYPPVLSYRSEDFREGGETSWQGRVRQSIAAYQSGKLSDALGIVAQTPQDAQGNPSFFTYRAALLLDAGRSDEANADLQTALGLDPNNGAALAQLAVIAITQNRNGEALEQAKRAVALSPQAASSWIALSYAEQAGFNLPAALDATQQAVDKDPGNALAWARLAELRLSLADLDGALAAAGKAATLNPDLARSQTVLGYARLVQIDTRAARQSFERAIALDASDPLPRLGLGLAKIRDGELAAGREEIEIATGLDPNNALVRSYMGKAYYEEKRSTLAATQFDIAKALDPNDPTPWFYDAILKQSTNRPVEALQNLDKSIDLNDNRAVYRSRLLLEQDQAARSASQARIYDDIGFQQLALREGWKSLNTDPANHSAHRFLSDAYATQPRHEIARASELLQAQLLQPININPVQPQQSETALNMLSGAGPASPSANEFNPLFQRNQFRLQVSGMGGSNNTWGNELVHSGLFKNVSYSLGQFSYDTNGFRANNDLRHNMYNAFIQANLSPKASVQFEYKSRETESGDITLRFDPTNFSATDRRSLDARTGRLGFRYSPSPNSAVITSVIHSNRQENLNLLSPSGLHVRSPSEVSGYTAEAQYLLDLTQYSLVTGASKYSGDRADDQIRDYTNTRFRTTCPARFAPCTSSTTTDIRHDNAYVYTAIRSTPQLLWTLGASYDDFRDDAIERSQLNPKFGMTWSITPDTTLRLAAFKAVKRPLASNQTIEPTQLAGFNQFFDDIDGAQSRRYGIGMDQRFSENIFAGMEFSTRKLNAPISSSGSPLLENLNEQMQRAYLSWVLSRNTTINAEYHINNFGREARSTLSSNDPLQLDTRRIPLNIAYFHPSGFFLRAGASHISQKIELPLQSGATSSDKSTFWIVDASVGYRLPKRLGIISLDAKNLLDKQFKYQDVNFQTSEPRNPLFQPVRAIYARFTFAL
ncbi:MAG: FecR domain-containing protein [Gammaproteobacteria bacterium]|nr:FecR domain-containing protein [Gammaproteobacteria bacterium]